MKKIILGLIACVSLLIPVGAGAGQVPEAFLRWANRLLASASFDNQMSRGSGNARWRLRDARQAFNDMLVKYGKQGGEVWLGLARAQAGLGEYVQAMGSYQEAAALLPHSKTVREELAKVQDQAFVARAASATLPVGEVVLQAVRYPAERNLWAVLSGRVKWDREPHPLWPSITGSRLTIFKGTPRLLRQIWRSGILGGSGNTSGEFNDIYLYVKDVTGSGVPDLILPEVLYGASWMPSHLDIYTWRGGRVAHLLGAISDDPLIMKDLSHDGRWEAMNDHAVGWSLAHYEQPRWIDIYAYRNGRYQLADEEFPAQYRDLYREVRAGLQEFPNDGELLYYLGRLYEIRGNPAQARITYLKAEQAAVKTVAEYRSKGWNELERRANDTLERIRDRIAALTRCRGTSSRT